jgi:tetratricopeptide (TPR) repeat protein
MAGSTPPAPGSPQPKPHRQDTSRPSSSESAAAGAKWFGSLSQLDFDIDFFERLLARNGESVEVLRTLAELVSQKGLWQRSLELDRRLVTLIPDDFLARYNLACSLARAGRPAEAIDTLSKAILLGYDDLAHLEVDPDLDSLRNHPEFRALLGQD